MPNKESISAQAAIIVLAIRIIPFHDLDFGGGEGACLRAATARQVKVIDQGVNLAIQAVAATGQGQVEFLVDPEIGNQFFDPRKGSIKPRRHDMTLEN
jgi:hypothetical protein